MTELPPLIQDLVLVPLLSAPLRHSPLLLLDRNNAFQGQEAALLLPVERKSIPTGTGSQTSVIRLLGFV